MEAFEQSLTLSWPYSRRVAQISRPPAWEEFVEAYIEEKRADGLKVQTLKDYRHVIHGCLNMLSDAGLRYRPRKVGMEEVNYLRMQFPPHGTNYRNLQFHMYVLVPFLEWCGNPVLRVNPLRYPTIRSRADWLDVPRMETIREAVEPFPDLLMLYQLEGCQGLRRCEVQRLTVHDFSEVAIRFLDIYVKPGPAGDRTYVFNPTSSFSSPSLSAL